jgi:hypothetical protein
MQPAILLWLLCSPDVVCCCCSCSVQERLPPRAEPDRDGAAARWLSCVSWCVCVGGGVKRREPVRWGSRRPSASTEANHASALMDSPSTAERGRECANPSAYQADPMPNNNSPFWRERRHSCRPDFPVCESIRASTGMLDVFPCRELRRKGVPTQPEPGERREQLGRISDRTSAATSSLAPDPLPLPLVVCKSLSIMKNPGWAIETRADDHGP